MTAPRFETTVKPQVDTEKLLRSIQAEHHEWFVDRHARREMFQLQSCGCDEKKGALLVHILRDGKPVNMDDPACAFDIVEVFEITEKEFFLASEIVRRWKSYIVSNRPTNDAIEIRDWLLKKGRQGAANPLELSQLSFTEDSLHRTNSDDGQLAMEPPGILEVIGRVDAITDSVELFKSEVLSEIQLLRGDMKQMMDLTRALLGINSTGASPYPLPEQRKHMTSSPHTPPNASNAASCSPLVGVKRPRPPVFHNSPDKFDHDVRKPFACQVKRVYGIKASDSN
jgi:hypothetical protein